MNEIQIIDQREVLGKDFKIYGDLENPIFLAKDVAEWIDYDPDKTGQLLNAVDNSEKLTATIYRSGQNREMWFLTEEGLYEIFMQSRKPIAKQFKTEVKAVLKSIRKHGAYLTSSKIEEILLNPDTIIKIASQLKEERAEKERLQLQIASNKSKVLFADAVSVSKSTILIGELAKILKQNGVDIGQNRLFEKLRKDGYLIRRKGTDRNMPTQKSMDMGLFNVKETVITHSDGHTSISKTVKVTGKGQMYFVNKFLSKSKSA